MDSVVDIDDSLLSSCTGTFGRVVTLSTVALACRFCMTVMNRTTVKNAGAVEEHLLHRREGDTVITVCNHTRCFFRAGKTLPLDRGQGHSQPVMQTLSHHLGKNGGWLHVFPEGRISFDGKLSDFRWGIGKTVCDIMKHSDKAPTVLPYYHSGMGRVLPYSSWIPRMGHNVQVTFGDPINLDDLTCNCNKDGVDQQQVWRDITRKIHDTLQDLESHSVANYDQVKDGVAPERFVHKRSKDR